MKGLAKSRMDAEVVAKYKWLLVVLAIVLVVLILLTLAGIDVLGIVGGILKSKKPDELVFWKRYDPLVPLRVSYDQVGSKAPFERYTMMVDMLWINTRGENPNAVYRHILHRGSGEGADFLQRVQDLRTKTPGPASPTAQEILVRMPQGLPIRMNPGILADPHTNDMLIFIDTEKAGKNYRESLRIPDIPMDQPFRLAILVMPNMIEVYINCQLEVTKIIDGAPRAIEEGWYGLVGPKPLNCMVQNLRIFNGILAPADMKTYCGKLPDFPAATHCQSLQ